MPDCLCAPARSTRNRLVATALFKDKPEEMGRLTNELVSHYQELAHTLQSLATQYPAVRIDVTTMPQIGGDERKAIGEDLSKDFAPLVGKTGVAFQREVLLMFYNYFTH